jgi:predicted nucleotidyltransferase
MLLMQLKHYPVEKLKKEILEIVGQEIDLSKYRVFFFGSRVENKGTERSDIDIGIEGPQPVPAEKFLNIQEKIENLPTLYKIEVVDFCRVFPEFREVARQQIEILQ